MIYSTRLFVLCLTLCCFVVVFFSPFSIAITSLGEERANFSAKYVCSICACLVLSVSSSSWYLGFVIVALVGLFSYLFLVYSVEKSYVANFRSLKVFRFKFIEDFIGIFNGPKIVNSVSFVNSIMVSDPIFFK